MIHQGGCHAGFIGDNSPAHRRPAPRPGQPSEDLGRGIGVAHPVDPGVRADRSHHRQTGGQDRHRRPPGLSLNFEHIS